MRVGGDEPPELHHPLGVSRARASGRGCFGSSAVLPGTHSAIAAAIRKVYGSIVGGRSRIDQSGQIASGSARSRVRMGRFPRAARRRRSCCGSAAARSGRAAWSRCLSSIAASAGLTPSQALRQRGWGARWVAVGDRAQSRAVRVAERAVRLGERGGEDALHVASVAVDRAQIKPDARGDDQHGRRAGQRVATRRGR